MRKSKGVKDREWIDDWGGIKAYGKAGTEMSEARERDGRGRMGRVSSVKTSVDEAEHEMET